MVTATKFCLLLVVLVPLASSESILSTFFGQSPNRNTIVNKTVISNRRTIGDIVQVDLATTIRPKKDNQFEQREVADAQNSLKQNGRNQSGSDHESGANYQSELNHQPIPYYQPGPFYQPGANYQPRLYYQPGPNYLSGASYQPGPFYQPGQNYQPGSYYEPGPHYQPERNYQPGQYDQPGQSGPYDQYQYPQYGQNVNLRRYGSYEQNGRVVPNSQLGPFYNQRGQNPQHEQNKLIQENHQYEQTSQSVASTQRIFKADQINEYVSKSQLGTNDQTLAHHPQNGENEPSSPLGPNANYSKNGQYEQTKVHNEKKTKNASTTSEQALEKDEEK